MNELEINRHSFKLAKKRLKEFSEIDEAELAIEQVETSGGFLGCGNHKVTGYELNDRLETIQNHFIAANTTTNKVIKEFREVYNALDALDKDYIASIVANVKAIEKTSNDVRIQQGILKEHHLKLEYQQTRLDSHQVVIDKNVANVTKIVTALKVFKEKLESYNHLTDIDNIWNDCQKWHNEISTISYSAAEAMFVSSENAKELTSVKESIEDTDGKIAQLSETVSKHTDRIESVSTFMNELETMTHLKDVDEIWCKVEDNSKSLDILTEQSNNNFELVQQNRANIVELTDYKHELSSIEHLKDVDNLWTASEKHSSQIKELQDQDEELRNLIQRNKELTDQAIAAEKEKTDAILRQLNKKIQYAYWLAGGTMAFALVELLVILLR